MSKRTAKDERDYSEHLRREEPIKTEVIVELRKHNRLLLENQERALEALVSATDSLVSALTALNNYRRSHLEATKAARGSESQCVPNCKRHKWDTEDGWTRQE